MYNKEQLQHNLKEGLLLTRQWDHSNSGLVRKKLNSALNLVNTSTPLIALVIGHKKASPGAYNPNQDLTEYEFNEQLAIQIDDGLSNVRRVYRRTYQELPSDINQLDPDYIISLHCNAYNSTTSGTEVLYYHRSEASKELASTFLEHLTNCLGLSNRGLKPKTTSDRGGYLLKYTRAPCIICESFFIDNDEDLEVAQEQDLAQAYIDAIQEVS